MEAQLHETPDMTHHASCQGWSYWTMTDHVTWSVMVQ